MITGFRYPEIAVMILLFYSKNEELEEFFPFLKEKKNNFSFVMTFIGGVDLLAKFLGVSINLGEKSDVVQELMELGYSRNQISITIDELFKKQFIKKGIIGYKVTAKGDKFLKNLSAVARKRGRNMLKEAMCH